MNCAGCCSENLGVTEIEKWTNNLNNLLMSDQGRLKFQDFLHSRHLEDAGKVLIFWEAVHRLELKIESEIAAKTVPPRNKRLQEFEELYSFADENIDFDFRQLQAFARFRNETDPMVLCQILRETKQSAKELLKDEHKAFSKVLMESIPKCSCT